MSGWCQVNRFYDIAEAARRIRGTDAEKILINPIAEVAHYSRASDALEELAIIWHNGELTDFGFEVQKLARRESWLIEQLKGA